MTRSKSKGSLISENPSINNKKFSVGETVFSSDFGIGTVSGIETLQDDGIYYYVVQYGNKKSKNYFPVKDNKKIRAVSTKEYFEDTLSMLKDKRELKSFDSKKDRQQYFERQVDKSHLREIIVMISELLFVEDLVPREQKIIDRMVETLELEAAVIYNIKESESKKLVSEYLVA